MSGDRIISKQNTEESLDRFAAASVFYGRGKIALGGQMALTLGLAVMLSLASAIHTDFKLWAAFISLTVTWLDVLFIDRIQADYRKLGAKTQELLDCELFDLDWNALRAGEKPLPEAVSQAAAPFRERHGDKNLRDWYPSATAELPLPLARLICQRACFWWETTQRRTYGHCLVALVVLALVVMVAFALGRAQSLGDMILSVYAPFAPAIVWSIREARRQNEAAMGLEKCRSFVDGVWGRAMSGELSSEQLGRTSRQIQDALFDGRSRNPLIFNWVYHRLRSENEQAMTQAAASLAKEAIQCRARWENKIT